MSGRTRVGRAETIPVILKVAKLEASLNQGGSVPFLDIQEITFDKETDEVVLIYAADYIPQNLNGLGTGSEVDCVVSTDLDEDVLDFDDESVIFAWHMTKSFVTSGMEITVGNRLKVLPHPLITSRPRVRVLGVVNTAIWTSGLANVYVYYTTRKLDAEARRVLIGAE